MRICRQIQKLLQERKLRHYCGAGIALFTCKKGKHCVLLGKRTINPGKNLWSFPGGGMNKRESFLDCAFREFHEETGVDLRQYNIYVMKYGAMKIRLPFLNGRLLFMKSKIFPVNLRNHGNFPIWNG